MKSFISIVSIVFSTYAFSTQAIACEDEVYRQFDYWLGEWEVHTLDGTYAGTNTIRSVESGCLVLENWQSASGGTGQSYNFYNPGTQSWRQVWVSRGTIIDYTGGFTDGAMRLEGNITYHQNGQTFPFRGAWTPQDNGNVEQKLEQWNPKTKSWDDWFTGIYQKKKGNQKD